MTIDTCPEILIYKITDVRAAPVIDSGTHEYIALLTAGDGLDAILGEASGVLDTMTVGGWLSARGGSRDSAHPLLRVVDANDSLLTACAIMRDDGVHHVPIVSDRTVLCVLNYGRLLRFLQGHLGARADRDLNTLVNATGGNLSPLLSGTTGGPSDVREEANNALNDISVETRLLSLTLAQLRLGTYDDLKTVREKDSVQEVLRALKEYNLRAVPVVNDAGELTNVYARSDVALLACADWGVTGTFNGPIIDVLNRVRQASFTVATCRLSDSLSDVFRHFEASRRHRLYIVDDKKHVIGVLTLNDLLRYFLEGY